MNAVHDIELIDFLLQEGRITKSEAKDMRAYLESCCEGETSPEAREE